MTSRVENVLKHYGVLGMRWGRRKDRGDSTPPGQVLVGTKPGAKVVVKGGKGVEPHEDAKKAAISKQIAKSSSIDALSTRDLQELVNRMNLEQQYAKLTDPKNKANKNSLQNGLKTVNQVLEAKKTYDKLTQDPFIREAVNGIKEDLGINNLIRKGAGKAAGAAFKPR